MKTDGGDVNQSAAGAPAVKYSWASACADQAGDPFLERARAFLMEESNMVSVFGDVEYNSQKGFTWVSE